jgi:hypothetical protein
MGNAGQDDESRRPRVAFFNYACLAGERGVALARLDSLLPPSPSLSPPSSRSIRRWSRPARACWRPSPPHTSARATWIRPVGSALTLSSSPSASR